MVAIIIICVVVFILVVLLFNYRTIVDKIKSKKQSKKEKDVEKPKKEKVTFTEDLVKKNTDNLKCPIEEEYTVEPFVMADEDELKELESKSKASGGRRSGDIKTISNIDVEVEELDDDEDYTPTFDKKNTIADQIKNLSPEIKALLLSDLLDKKD